MLTCLIGLLSYYEKAMGFNENLKSELDYQNMLVKELEAKSGVGKNTLDSYLSARKKLPNVDTAVKIAKALGVSVEYLVTGEDNQKNAPHNLNKTSRLIGQFAEQLDPQKREFALEFIKWLSAWKDKIG